MPFYVYILRSQTTGRFYVGHTENLTKRIYEHSWFLPLAGLAAAIPL